MSNDNKIFLSVLMPVHNSEKFLSEAITSILTQTHEHFEFIIINDGSTDDSDKIVRSFNDPRINYIENKVNKGIVNALNQGLQLCKGKYVARMDSDDISTSNRLEKQLAFLENNPNYKLCGSNAITIRVDGLQLIPINRPLNFEKIRVFNFFRNAFIHPSIMAETILFKQIGYDENYKYAEDYLSFSKFTMSCEVANLKERLLLYRIHDESTTASKKAQMIASELKTIKYLLSFLFEEVSEKSLLIHHSFLRPKKNQFSANEIEQHLEDISLANNIKNVFNQRYLAKQLQQEWYNYLMRESYKSPLTLFIKSPIFKFFSAKQILKLTCK